MIETKATRHKNHAHGKLAVMTLTVISLCFILFFPKAGLADESGKLVFGSINKPNSRLYRISETVLTHAFESLGVEFELKAFPPNRIPKEINNGKMDGDTHRIYNFNLENKYPNLLRVEESIQTVDQSVFTKKKDIKVEGWKSLSSFRVLYLSGIVLVEKGLDLAAIPPENRFPVYDIDNAFHLLDLGRGDIVIVSPSTGQGALKKLGITDGDIKMLHPPVVTINLYPYMHKKHDGLAKKLAAKIREMKKTGLYAEIVSSIKE